MKCLIVFAHPYPRAFNRAVLQAVDEELKAAGHEVNVRDLYVLNFHPALQANDLEGLIKGTTEPDVAEEQKHVTWADLVILICPIWWSGLPAMAKGYIDCDHTLAHFRRDTWLPPIMDRSGFAGPEQEQAVLDRLQEKVDELIAAYQKPEVAADRLAKMRRVVDRAAKALLA